MPRADFGPHTVFGAARRSRARPSAAAQVPSGAQTGDAEAAERMKAVNAAHDLLRDPARRRAHPGEARTVSADGASGAAPRCGSSAWSGDRAPVGPAGPRRSAGPVPPASTTTSGCRRGMSSSLGRCSRGHRRIRGRSGSPCPPRSTRSSAPASRGHSGGRVRRRDRPRLGSGTYEHDSSGSLEDALAEGHARLVPHGHRLRDGFALTRLGGGRRARWLLEDDAARPDAEPLDEEPTPSSAAVTSTRSRRGTNGLGEGDSDDIIFACPEDP